MFLNSSIELNPQELTIDFEQAVMNAFKYHFPRIQISACFFHFGQNIYRKIVEIGLKVQYSEDENLKSFVKKIIYLALLPIDKVDESFCDLCEFEVPEYEEMGKFLDYVTLTYIDEPLFPIELWNHYDDNDNKRSNNDAEGYNLWLNTWLHTHPNIWKFIGNLKAEESTSYLKFLRINDGSFKKKNRKSKDVQRDLLIQTAKLNLITKKLDVKEYLMEVSKVVQDFETGDKKKKNSSTASSTASSSLAANLTSDDNE
jgi:hypothetical protein